MPVWFCGPAFANSSFYGIDPYFTNIEIPLSHHTLLRAALKPGGYILLTTLCRMEQDAYTEDFIQYAEDWDYFLVTVDDHQNLLENAGFGRVSCSSH